jgi:hypothetical protein
VLQQGTCSRKRPDSIRLKREIYKAFTNRPSFGGSARGSPAFYGLLIHATRRGRAYVLRVLIGETRLQPRSEDTKNEKIVPARASPPTSTPSSSNSPTEPAAERSAAQLNQAAPWSLYRMFLSAWLKRPPSRAGCRMRFSRRAASGKRGRSARLARPYGPGQMSFQSRTA